MKFRSSWLVFSLLMPHPHAVEAAEQAEAIPVQERWEIIVGDEFTLKEYATILDCLSIELGILGIGEVTCAKSLSTGRPEVYRRPVSKEKRAYWLSTDKRVKQADEELFDRAHIVTKNKKVLHFFADPIVQQLLQLEHDYRGREPSSVRKTQFGVHRKGDSYAFYVAGQDAIEDKSTYEFECRWAEGRIVIDGKGDEPAWGKAQVIDRFALPWLGDEARPAKTATKARLLWDRDYVYFFAQMQDTDLYADVTEHDGMTWDNDVFELFFKPKDDQPGYYEFQVNAAGTIMDMFLPRRGSGGYRRFKSDGVFHIDAKVSLAGTLNHWQDKDTGWSVEGRIAWKDFERTGGRPADGEQWKFALCRYDYSVEFEGPELSTCAPLKSRPASFHNHEEYAELMFVGPNDQGRRDE